MKLRFTPRAMNDLTAIRRFIRDEYGNPKAAKRITDSIFAQCTNLKQFPQSARRSAPVLKSTRMCAIWSARDICSSIASRASSCLSAL